MAAVWQDVLEYFLDITNAQTTASMDLLSTCVEELTPGCCLTGR